MKKVKNMVAILKRFVENERKLQEDIMLFLGNALVQSQDIERFLILQNFLWGGWLLFPGRTSNLSQSSEIFGIRGDMIWGIISTCLGLAIVLGSWRNWPRLKKFGLLASSSWWLWIAVFFAMRNIESTGAPTYIAIGVSAGLAYIKFELLRERKG